MLLRDVADEASILKAATLAEALPYIQAYAGQSIVIKFGGAAMDEPLTLARFAEDVVLLQHVGLKPIVVHGGGPQIGDMLKRLNVETRFENGLRVTDEAAVDVVEMVLCGSTNKKLVRAINAAGGRAVGLAGSDAQLIRAEPLDPALGFVGRPAEVRPGLLTTLTQSDKGFIPVIAPVGFGDDDKAYNINADTAAGAIAAALRATRLMLLTDVDGLLDAQKRLIRSLTLQEARAMLQEGVATGGMIPKLETAVAARESGVDAVVILNGRKPHELLVELFTENGAGTLVG